MSQGNNLACTTWENPEAPTTTYLIYLHTNTRSVIDATELLPLCSSLNCNMISFDFPGCGLSSGSLSLKMAQDIENVTSSLIGKDSKHNFILWSRGMSSAPAIEWISRFSYRHNINYVVLDTPFLSIRQMVRDGINKLRGNGLSFPSPVLGMVELLVRNHLRSVLSYDILEVDCATFAPSCHVPVTVLSALQDDYIPVTHGESLASMWGASHLYRTFNGRHFGARPMDMVLSVIQDMAQNSFRKVHSEPFLSGSAHHTIQSCSRPLHVSKSVMFLNKPAHMDVVIPHAAPVINSSDHGDDPNMDIEPECSEPAPVSMSLSATSPPPQSMYQRRYEAPTVSPRANEVSSETLP